MKTIRVAAPFKIDLGMFFSMICATGAVCLVFTAVPALPQVSGALLSGTVTDSTDAAVAGAQVVIRNVSTGIERKAVSDSNGLYSAPNLIPGIYDLTVKATGFTTERRQGVVLNVGATKVVDCKLQVGAVTAQVEVQDVAPLLQLGTSESTAIVDSPTVRELPLNGRSWTDLAALQPGVVLMEDSFNAASGLDRGLKGFGAQLSISGGRPVQNNYRLDGVSVNDYANGGPTNVLGGALGVDAIQEFSVITSNYSAQYGRTSGGVVNAITRSGTNEFHGSAYEFFRDSALDARNYFDYDTNGNPYKAPFRRHQFGGSAGGPIVKDRTFIFGDYEGIRQSKGIATQAIVPSAAARSGNLSTGTVVVDPAAAKYLQLYPLPNVSSVGGDAGIFSFTAQQEFNEDFFTTKVDHSFSEKNSLSGTYLFDNTPFSAPDGMDLTRKGHHIRRQFAVFGGTHVFSPTLLNSFHVGANRVAASINQNMSVVNQFATDTSFAAIPGQGPARIFMNGFSLMPGGVGGAAHVFHGFTSYQAYDDVFLTRGTHSFKFGVSLENIRNDTTSFQGAGDWTFGSLSAFLTNKPLSFVGTLVGFATPRDVHQLVVGTYIQDDWRVRKNLTLNLGLRYEAATVPSEVHGKYVTLLDLTAPQAKIGGQLFPNPTLHNFEPRLGFAWDPMGDSRTVVHGSAGMFDVLPLPYVMDLLEPNAAPFSEVGFVQSGLNGKFYAGGFPLLTPQTLGSAYVQQNPHRNYVMTWSLNVQRQVTENLGVVVGYVGSHAVHQQFKVDDSDMTLPHPTPYGYVFPYSTTGSPSPTLNPAFGDIRSLWWNGISSYEGLQVGATKRLSKGVQLQGSFTWSKSLDNSSSGAGSDSYGNSLSSLHWYDLAANKSLSDYNTARVFTLSTIWEVPAPSISSAFGEKLLKGWELGTIFTAQDGQPFTVLLGGDVLGQNSSDPFSFPSRVGGPGCRSMVDPGNVAQYIKLQCFSMPTTPDLASWNANCNPAPPTLLDSNGIQIRLNNPQNPALDGAGWLPPLPCFNLRGNARRNILVGPGFANLDFSIYKNTALFSDRFTTQFRVEFFNVLNHTNFQGPLSNNVLFDQTGAPVAGAGTLTQTTHDSREIQIALKLLW